MEYRQLGNAGLRVPVLSFGTAHLAVAVISSKLGEVRKWMKPAGW